MNLSDLSLGAVEDLSDVNIPELEPLHRHRGGLSRLGDAANTTHRRPRWRIVATIVAVFTVMLSAAGVQVNLIGNQRHLDAVNADIRSAQERQYSLRRQETLLKSPQEVASIATSKLGMVPPAEAMLVHPLPEVIGTPTTLPSTASTASTQAVPLNASPGTDAEGSSR